MTRKSDYAFWTFVMLACLAGATTVLNVSRTYSATSTNSEIYKQLDLFGDVLMGSRVIAGSTDRVHEAGLGAVGLADLHRARACSLGPHDISHSHPRARHVQRHSSLPL